MANQASDDRVSGRGSVYATQHAWFAIARTDTVGLSRTHVDVLDAFIRLASALGRPPTIAEVSLDTRLSDSYVNVVTHQLMRSGHLTRTARGKFAQRPATAERRDDWKRVRGPSTNGVRVGRYTSLLWPAIDVLSVRNFEVTYKYEADTKPRSCLVVDLEELLRDKGFKFEPNMEAAQ